MALAKYPDGSIKRHTFKVTISDRLGTKVYENCNNVVITGNIMEIYQDIELSKDELLKTKLESKSYYFVINLHEIYRSEVIKEVWKL
jgi:hypothetical protein